MFQAIALQNSLACAPDAEDFGLAEGVGVVLMSRFGMLGSSHRYMLADSACRAQAKAEDEGLGDNGDAQNVLQHAGWQPATAVCLSRHVALWDAGRQLLCARNLELPSERRPEAGDEGLAAEVLMSRFGMLDGGCAALPQSGAPWLVRTPAGFWH